MPSIVLQPDAADGMDTVIYTSIDWPVVITMNFGVSTWLNIGEDNSNNTHIPRLLVKFDLTSLPPTAQISSAVLSLYCDVDKSSNARTFRVYRTKRAWVEGTRDIVEDNPPTGATWIRYDTVNNWSTAGGFHVDDCEQTDIGSRNFTATETLNEFKNFALTPTTKVGLDLGNGWMLKADTELNDQYGFVSSDHATAAWRPKLVVEYTLPVAGGNAPFSRTFINTFRGPMG